MTRSTFVGIFRVDFLDTKIITTKASGTLHAAGWRSINTQNESLFGIMLEPSRASPQLAAPANMPAIAPRAVKERHQMPSSSSGQIVDAVNAKTLPIAPASANELVSKATTTGIAVASTVEILKPRTVPLKNSCESAPANETANPEVVDKNAANAPPTTTAVNKSARTPSKTLCGKSKMVASALDAERSLV